MLFFVFPLFLLISSVHSSQTISSIKNKQLFDALESSLPMTTEIDSIFKEGAQIDAQDAQGRTFLHYAAWHGNEELIKYFLDKGAWLEALDNLGATPLHYAVRDGHLKTVELLLKSRALVNAKTDDNWTSLHFAVFANQFEIAEKLLHWGAQTDIKNSEGKTPLDFIQNEKMEEILKRKRLMFEMVREGNLFTGRVLWEKMLK